MGENKYAEPWSRCPQRPQDRDWRKLHGEGLRDLHIRTTPERLWEAITNPEIRAKYNFGAEVHSDWTVGSRMEMGVPDVAALGEGEILEVDPPSRLVPHR